MNTVLPRWVAPLRAQAHYRSGFSLTEILVSLAILGVATAALIIGQIYGMKMFNVTATKLGAAQGARTTLGVVRDDVRAGKMLYVGTGTGANFTNIVPGFPQEGNALRIFPTSDTNSHVTYYLDSSDQKLKRRFSGTGAIEVIAPYITNTAVFRAEDYAGNILTNAVNNRIIRMTLDFYQWEFPVAQAGVGSFYDHYRLQTRISRRAID
jgi:prepilin-type N-terminal cleavage/methylation domain-containing protein